MPLNAGARVWGVFQTGIGVTWHHTANEALKPAYQAVGALKPGPFSLQTLFKMVQMLVVGDLSLIRRLRRIVPGAVLCAWTQPHGEMPEGHPRAYCGGAVSFRKSF